MTPNAHSLTPKIRALVSRDHHARPPVGRLTEAHIAALEAVAAGRVTPGEDVSAPQAISALAEGAPESALPVAVAVLQDDGRPRPDQISAARALGSIGSAKAETAILKLLPSAEPRVQQELLASLGRFASSRAGEALERLTVGDDDATKRQLDFARALIAHRHGIDGPFLREVPVADEPEGQGKQRAKVSLTAKTPAGTTADLRRMAGPVYGIEIAQRGLGLTCGPTDLTVFLNAALGPTADDLAPLFSKPFLAGVIAERYPTGERLSTRLVVLTRPVKQEVHLDLARADGVVAYVGTVTRTGEGLSFIIRDAERAGRAPTHLAGTVTSRGVNLTTAISLTERSGVRATLDVDTPGRTEPPEVTRP